MRQHLSSKVGKLFIVAAIDRSIDDADEVAGKLQTLSVRLNRRRKYMLSSGGITSDQAEGGDVPEW